MRFIVANYGPRHAGMLLAHLHSVARSHPDAAVSVYWQDIPGHLLDALRTVCPNGQFEQTNYNFAQNPLQRISSKVLCWARAAEEHEADAMLVFCDSDTLIRRNLRRFFDIGSEHIVVTVKPENVPLNSGVVLARGGPEASAFFRAWRDETLSILQTPELFSQANDLSKPYGGTDQMSLYRLLNYSPETELYMVKCGEHQVRVGTEPCAMLNETNSRPLTDQIHVVHYKAGWQRILIDGRPFSRFRPRAASWEMMEFFLETFSEALARANVATGRHYTASEFGIRWPWYYRSGQFSPPAYAAWRVKEAAKRAWLMATGQLKPGM